MSAVQEMETLITTSKIIYYLSLAKIYKKLNRFSIVQLKSNLLSLI